MKFSSCSHHQEVATALRERQWPELSTPELRLHVEGCAECREVALVTQTLQQARQKTMAAARPTPPGLLWWRARLRRRNAEVERAAKPIAVVETLALAGTLVVVAAMALARRPEIADWLDGLVDIPSFSAFLDSLWSITGGPGFWLLLIASVATLGLVGGVAACLVTRSE